MVCLVTWVIRASSEVESSALVSNTLRIPYSCADSPLSSSSSSKSARKRWCAKRNR